MRFITVFILWVSLSLSGSVMAQAPSPAQLTPQAAEQARLTALLTTPLFKPALDYDKIARIEECRDEVTRNILYHNCRDSQEIYDAALANAKAEGLPLMVIFGFNRCPNCVSMHRQLFNPQKPVQNGHLVSYFTKSEVIAFVDNNTPLKLPVVHIHGRTDHGQKLAAKLGATEMAKARGWHRVWSPFVLFVHPETGDIASQSFWEPAEFHCDWNADFAKNLEEIGYIKSGPPAKARKMCQRPT